MTDPNRPLTAFLTDAQIAELPDQRGLRSWAFEPYLELDHRVASITLESVLNDIRDHWMRDFQRKPNPERQRNFVSCLRVILLNLLRVRVVDTKLTVGIPSGKGRLDAERRYLPDFMSVQYHRTALRALIGHGLIYKVKSGHRQETYAETARYALTETGAKLLFVSGLTARAFLKSRLGEVIQLKDAYGRLTKYNDTCQTHAMRANARRLNDLLAVTDINTSRPLDTGREGDNRSVMERTDLYRIFNNSSFQQGGRFYGGWWQNLKKLQRRFITIEGQPTVEADFRGLHPAILFAKNGLSIPSDPYALVPGVAGNETLREHAKKTLLALLNASDGDTAEPRGFDSEVHGMTAEHFRQVVRDAFHMLPGIFGAGIGLSLQSEDSDLAEQIMLHFADLDVPVLPVHDSFIVTRDHEHDLIKVMQEVFHSRYGQIPKVTVTRH
ncbi:hypothetical protein [Limimaricola cinnabarinus]|nr:hypothetical protein [Limimaricola cinnabarinus]